MAWSPLGVHCQAPAGLLPSSHSCLVEVVEVAVRPLGRGRRPRALQTAGDRVAGVAGAVRAGPAEPLLLDRRALRLRSDVPLRACRAVCLAERVAARDQRDRLLVVHRHAAERLADVPGGGERIGLALRSLRVHVDQAHLHRGQRLLQVAVALVALRGEPLALRSPEDVVLRLPHVGASAAEAEHLQTRRLERAVAGEDHQVGPRDLLAVLLLHRPEQPARLVDVGVVGPRVERREADRAVRRAAAAVAHAVGPGAVPGHADEQPAVRAPVGRPPVLRRGHHLLDVLLDRREVELRELGRVVEVFAQRIALGGVLMKDGQVETVRPPVLIRHGGRVTRLGVAGAVGRLVRHAGDRHRRDRDMHHRHVHHRTGRLLRGRGRCGAENHQARQGGDQDRCTGHGSSRDVGRTRPGRSRPWADSGRPATHDARNIRAPTKNGHPQLPISTITHSYGRPPRVVPVPVALPVPACADRRLERA